MHVRWLGKNGGPHSGPTAEHGRPGVMACVLRDGAWPLPTRSARSNSPRNSEEAESESESDDDDDDYDG